MWKHIQDWVFLRKHWCRKKRSWRQCPFNAIHGVFFNKPISSGSTCITLKPTDPESFYTCSRKVYILFSSLHVSFSNPLVYGRFTSFSWPNWPEMDQVVVNFKRIAYRQDTVSPSMTFTTSSSCINGVKTYEFAAVHGWLEDFKMGSSKCFFYSQYQHVLYYISISILIPWYVVFWVKFTLVSIVERVTLALMSLQQIQIAWSFGTPQTPSPNASKPFNTPNPNPIGPNGLTAP